MKIYRNCCFILIALTLCTTIASGQETLSCRRSQSSGFHGLIDVGFFITSYAYKSLENKPTSDEKKVRTQNVEDLQPMVFFQFAQLTEQDWCLYIGNSDYSGILEYNAGVSHFFDDIGHMDLALTYGETQVYKDYYQDDAENSFTRQSENGVRLIYSYIYNTPFGFRYHYKEKALDDDKIGDRYDELSRKGKQHEVGVQYVIFTGDIDTWIPSLNYIQYGADGDNESFEGTGGSMFLRVEHPEYLLESSFSLMNHQYHKEHVVFRKQRQDWYFEGLIGVSLYNILDKYPEVLLNINCQTAAISSTISFFDSNVITFATSLAYIF